MKKVWKWLQTAIFAFSVGLLFLLLVIGTVTLVLGASLFPMALAGFTECNWFLLLYVPILAVIVLMLVKVIDNVFFN